MALAMLLNRLEVAVGAGGKTGLDHVHLQAFELARDAQFFVLGHGRAGRLFAVAQSGVKNDQFVSHLVSPVVPGSPQFIISKHKTKGPLRVHTGL